MVWSLTDSKSTHVSRTLLGILADLNNVVVIVSTRPLTPVPVSILWWLYQEYQLWWVSPSFSCSKVFFPILWQGPGTYLSFRFLSILPYGQPGQRSILFDIFLFLDYRNFWDEAWFLSFRVFGQLSSSLYLQRFGRYFHWPSSRVSCRIRESTQNFELRGSLVLIPLNISRYKW